jgi:hypothetical protein
LKNWIVQYGKDTVIICDCNIYDIGESSLVLSHVVEPEDLTFTEDFEINNDPFYRKTKTRIPPFICGFQVSFAVFRREIIDITALLEEAAAHSAVSNRVDDDSEGFKVMGAPLGCVWTFCDKDA